MFYSPFLAPPRITGLCGVPLPSHCPGMASAVDPRELATSALGNGLAWKWGRTEFHLRSRVVQQRSTTGTFPLPPPAAARPPSPSPHTRTCPHTRIIFMLVIITLTAPALRGTQPVKTPPSSSHSDLASVSPPSPPQATCCHAPHDPYRHNNVPSHTS